jgi:hypothetical protein
MPEHANKKNRKSSITSTKDFIKRVLGEVPLTAEIYWLIRHRSGTIRSRFSLTYLDQNLTEICAQVEECRKTSKQSKKVFLFSSLHTWLHHAVILGLGLSADGHDVTLGYLPYSDWFTPINRFDLRRQNLYAQRVLKKATPCINPVSFLTTSASYKSLPKELEEKITQVSRFDAQYTDQMEHVNEKSAIFQLRQTRNLSAGRSIYSWLMSNRPDVIIVPNGTIFEFGVVYEVAQFLKIPVVTYEFDNQQQRIWLAQNDKVMRQDSEALWKAFENKPLTNDESVKIHALFESRKKASVWKNFSRLWQSIPAEGVQQAREKLGLDNRPVVLLATNVLGDSLTLGRQVFSQSMQEWIERTVQYFAGRTDVQLVIRIHPGEVLTHGASMVDVVANVLPKLPEQIHLIKPEEKVNTYDLIAAADVGLVYTTTVGLEMAMSGVPVIVSGNTHYRGRGFTIDPVSWLRYFKELGTILTYPKEFRLREEQIKTAWAYAYSFFFNFPRPFPWHLHHLSEDYSQFPIKKVFSKMGRKEFGTTFNYLVGEPLDWDVIRKKG